MSRLNPRPCIAPAAILMLALLIFPGASPAAEDEPSRATLRVCADPNNLPFSNRRQEGFENRIAELLAAELDARLEYSWWAQRRGFLRNTLKAGSCDVVMGMPSNHESVLTTRPYYRSTYVFLSRAERRLEIDSFDDPALRDLRIGVHLIGDDGANTPPAHALIRRQIVDNVVGYMIYGDYAEENPPARLVEAVAQRDVDLAVVWGPFAGYFAPAQRVEMAMAPVSAGPADRGLPFVYSISVGTRRSDAALKDQLDAILHQRRTEVDAILADFGIPRL